MKLDEVFFGFSDNKLRLYTMTIIYEGFKSLDREKALEFKDKIDGIVNEFNEKAGKGVNKAWHVAYDHWPWLEFRG
jgi:hypothetical protein